MNRTVGLRRLTAAGIEAFRGCLEGLRNDDGGPPPAEWVEDRRLTEPACEGIAVEARPFASRYDFARYADRLFEREDPDRVFRDVGLWAWLSLFFFDQVCPERGGVRRPGRDYRHIPDLGFRSVHRHLLSGAFLVHAIYAPGDRLAEFLLYGPLPSESRIFHEIVSRQSLVTNPAVIEAAARLYFNFQTRRPKRGVYQRKSPGALARFITVIQQLDLTWDLYSMTWERIHDLLPAEFDDWKQ